MAGSDARGHCQLYLVMEVQAASREHLAALLAKAAIASVLFKPARGAALTAQTVKPLVDLAQSKNVAALLLDDSALARTLRADGVHLSASIDVLARYEDARSLLGARASIGADAGGSRHVAMELGEVGADYVAFGDTTVPLPVAADEAAEEGQADLLGPMTQYDLVAWWSDVFEVPCVAFDVASADEAAKFATAGADFVAVTCPTATSTADVTEWFGSLRQAVEAIDA